MSINRIVWTDLFYTFLYQDKALKKFVDFFDGLKTQLHKLKYYQKMDDDTYAALLSTVKKMGNLFIDSYNKKFYDVIMEELTNEYCSIQKKSTRTKP